MSREQVAAEKVALQKALLCLEERHGRPAQKRDRDLVRPLYERYRLVKRLALKSGSVSGRRIDVGGIDVDRCGRGYSGTEWVGQNGAKGTRWGGLTGLEHSEFGVKRSYVTRKNK